MMFVLSLEWSLNTLSGSIRQDKGKYLAEILLERKRYEFDSRVVKLLAQG